MSTDSDETWEAHGTHDIEVNEGAGQLAWITIDPLMGTPLGFATAKRDQIIADHTAAAAAREAVEALAAYKRKHPHTWRTDGDGGFLCLTCDTPWDEALEKQP